MCYFITLAIRTRAADRIQEVFGREFMLPETRNPSLGRALPEGYCLKLLITGMCSCDLYAPHGAGPPAPDVDRLRKKYAKLGWSQAKSERAIAAAVAKHEAEPNYFQGLRPDIAEKLADFATRWGTTGLYVHFYNGDIETEELPMHEEVRWSHSSIVAHAREVPADSWVWIRHFD